MLTIEMVKVRRSRGVLSIDRLYVRGKGMDGYYGKAALYDVAKALPGLLRVGQAPHPPLKPVVSAKGRQYVRSKPAGTGRGNLIKLPLS